MYSSSREFRPRFGFAKRGQARMPDAVPAELDQSARQHPGDLGVGKLRLPAEFAAGMSRLLCVDQS